MCNNGVSLAGLTPMPQRDLFWMHYISSACRVSVVAVLIATVAVPALLAQNNRVLSTINAPNVGATASFQVTAPPSSVIGLNTLGWWLLTDPSPTAIPLPLGFQTNGLYRGGLIQLASVAWSPSIAPNIARLDLQVPPVAGLVGFAFDVLTFDLTINANGWVGTWSDNDLEVAVGSLAGCGNSLLHQPLYPVGAPQEPDIVTTSATAMTTKIADRARRRHARDNPNGLGPVVPITITNPLGLTVAPINNGYDEWKDHYWEQRTLHLEIEDRVAVGGTEIVFRWKTFARLAPAEFRFFYRRESEPTNASTYRSNRSDYLSNSVQLVSGPGGVLSSNPNQVVGLEWVYETTLTNYEGYGVNRPLQIGDAIEFEPSQFMTPSLWATQLQNGSQSNYYGTTFLYVVGEGLQPWYAKEVETNTPGPDGRISYESYPLPDAGYLAGDLTLHYLYSGETTYRYKQATSNLAHGSTYAFFNGRRLHHTDFETGNHSEANNPTLQAHIDQLGPKFTGRSCISCHVNNGRSLLPTIGGELQGFVLNVAADADGTPHPTLGDTLQPYSVTDPQQWQIEVENSTFSGGGIQTIASADPNDPNGQAVVFSAPGDFAVYANIDLPATANYLVEVRYESSMGAALKFEQAGGSPLYAMLQLPATAGQWQTVSQTVNLPTTQITPAIAYDGSSASAATVNWLRISELPGPSVTPGEGAVTLAGWIPYDDGYNAYVDGTPYLLRKPQLAFAGTAPQFYSLRMAQPLIGLGLLEAVDEATFLAFADPCDSNQDGISGRAAYVTDLANGQQRLGRFNWKGGAASIADQIAYAFNRDMGVATTRLPTLDGETQPSSVEVSDTELDRMARYIGLLGVNARRSLTTPGALSGELLFTSIGCAACHIGEFTTGTTHPWGEVRGQTIRPYTDMLLHDMGPGLADNMRVRGSGATAAEWRTPALWSLGLSEDVSGGSGYLHDGRALTLEEAILWHGGEAATAKQMFRSLNALERSDILTFLRSL